MNTLAAICSREMPYQVVAQADSNISGHNEAYNYPPFFGITRQIRKLNPTHDPDDMERAFDSGSCNKNIWNYVGFSESDIFNHVRHLCSPSRPWPNTKGV